jgi:hypothetical protein
VRIAHRRIGDQQLLLLTHPGGKTLRTHLQQLVPQSLGGEVPFWYVGIAGSRNSRFGSNFPFTSAGR